MKALARAADADDPSVPDGSLQFEVELEQIGVVAIDSLVVVPSVPDFQLACRFSADNAMPFAGDLLAAAAEWATRARAGPLAGGAPDPALVERLAGAVLPLAAGTGAGLFQQGLNLGAAADEFATGDSGAGERPGPGRGRGGRGRGAQRQTAASEKAALLARIAALETALVAGQPSLPPSGSEGLRRGGARAPEVSPFAPAPLDALFVPPGAGRGAHAQAAESARSRAAQLLGAAGARTAPFPETLHGAAPPRGVGAAAGPAPGLQLPGDLADRVLRGGGDAAHALRLLELQILTQLSANAAMQPRMPDDDPFSMYAEGSMHQGGTGTRGSASINQLHRTVQQRPEQVVQAFNASIQRELETDVTGLPWSLRTYVERRLRFAADQEAEQRFVAILCRMHALHLAGPDQWWRLGATIAQSFKALEHYTVERDWQMAWCWLDLPDPRPQPGLARGLASPSEHTAAVAYLREVHLLAAQRQAVAGRSAWPSSGEHQEPPPVRRQERPVRHAPQAASAAPAAARPEANPNRARRQRGGGKGAAGGSAGD
jgi:hypothetical protein